ncbi:MAG: hypothetical protein KI793_06605 [Rivularia sp. (in: Bacteria)]|nr:hypothetical protein [Rivularia sp. MS3]
MNNKHSKTTGQTGILALATTATVLLFTNLPSLARTNDYTDTSVVQPTTSKISNQSVSPFALVNLAYDGYLEDQGIPGFGAFRSEYKLGRIDAAKLIQAGAKDNRISSQDLNDKSYLNAVKSQLRVRFKSF